MHFAELKIPPVYTKSSQRRCYYLQSGSTNILHFQVIIIMCIFSVIDRKRYHSLNYSVLAFGGQTLVVDNYLICLIIPL